MQYMIYLQSAIRSWRERAKERKRFSPTGSAIGPFASSFHIRHLDSGSCNACELELVALSGPHYDSARFGIDFVASPRHADGLVLTGPVTRNLAEAVAQTIEATPQPRSIIACGDCALGCGPFAGSYAMANRPDYLAQAEWSIPGCPPKPSEILSVLVEAKGTRS